jgi:hypothetical protein
LYTPAAASIRPTTARLSPLVGGLPSYTTHAHPYGNTGTDTRTVLCFDRDHRALVGPWDLWGVSNSVLVCAPVVCALYVHQGELKATKGGTEGEVCPRLHTSDYFGEIALILDRVS